MATLTYSHFGNPGRSLHEAPYNIVHKKSRLELFSDLLTYQTIVMRFSADLVDCTPRRLVAAA